MTKKIFSKKVLLPHLKDFKQSLFWNLFDSVGTQGLLILYHILFRTYLGTELHGKVGCTLSLFYLGIIVFNLGLDYTLAPFLEYITQSKRHFRSFLLWIMVPQLCFITFCSLIFYAFFPTLQSWIPAFKTFGHATDGLLLTMGLTFIFESMKRTAKYFLQLAFYTSLTACVEVIGMFAYVLLIFLSAAHGSTITLAYTWQMLGLLSLIQLCCLCMGIFALYKKLPFTTTAHPWPDLAKRIFKNRLFSWSTQCMNQLFSGNFLVPICALQFGLESASLMKVLTSISYWITYLANKVFGVTGNALLAHVKTRSLETQQKAFEYISFLLTQALYSLLIFLMLNGKKIALLQIPSTASIQWSLLYFMLIISFFESFFIIYEKWYILEEKASIFFLFNFISFGALYALYPYTRSVVAMLILIITLRLFTFFILSMLSFYRWRIWPSLKPDARIIATATGLSMLFFIFF